MSRITNKIHEAESKRLETLMTKDPNWSTGAIIQMKRELARTADEGHAEFWRAVGWWEGRIDERDQNG